MPDVAAELVRRRVDIIVASGTPSVLPARDVAGQIPVVFVATLDPVATGLVASLARPGRNVTGMTSISGDVIAKRLQMIRELLPNLTRIAILVRESSPTAAQYVQESQAAARNMGIELQTLIERNPKISTTYSPRCWGRTPWWWQMMPSLLPMGSKLRSERSEFNYRPFPDSGKWWRLAVSWLMERVSANFIGVPQAMCRRFCWASVPRSSGRATN